MKKIDFHAHILPGCDHGSKDTENSLKQLQLASEAGVDVICATSHYYAHKESVEEFLQRRERCFDTLMNAKTEKAPEILPGAEVLAFEGIEKLPELHKLCLSESNLLLLEMPFSNWTDGLIQSVESLCLSSDFEVVLAHVDRYEKEKINLLCESGALCQLNADSTSSVFAKRHLKQWVADGLVVAFGSDIHGVRTGYSDWKKTQKRHSDLFEIIMKRTNEMMLQSKEFSENR